MPQTVPSPRGNPCEFGDFDAFDLSLLPAPAFAPALAADGDFGAAVGSSWPSLSFSGAFGAFGAFGAVGASDGEVPYSPTSVSQLMSLFCDASPQPMSPTAAELDAKAAAKQQQQDEEEATKAVKTEPLLGSCSSWENQSTAFLFSPGASPSASPAYVKQEQQQDASVPQMDEDAGDHQLLREVLKDTSFQRKFNLKPFDLGGLGGLAQQLQQPWAAPLRRTLSGGAQGVAQGGALKMEQGDEGDFQQLDQDAIEPMISLAIQQMRNDIGNTCSMLGIAPDPALWTPEDVRAWIMWTVRQFSLPPVQLPLFDMEGAALAALTEADLTQRAPQSGSLLFAQLEIWKASCAEDMDCSRGGSPAPLVPALAATPGPAAPLMQALEVPSAALLHPVASPIAPATPATPAAPTPLSEHGACSPGSQFNSSASSADTSDDEDEDLDGAAGGAPASGSAASSAASSASSARGSHIHLWQFLKELLSSPQVHGSCVRWLDRPGGVFKIEDSVRVARLWGARKNRPAMNYDKLSRSIRQYYKKGIMKKTERSQRLVYQFCHPYSL